MTDVFTYSTGEISYWPNLGYGRFGAKSIMGNAPVFDRCYSANIFATHRYQWYRATVCYLGKK
jgi:hypothetical protein